MKKIIVCDAILDIGVDILRNANDVELIEAAKIPKDKLLTMLADVDIAITRSSTDVDEKFLDAAKNLKAAAYSIYGPRLEFVLCAEKVELFRLDKEAKFSLVKELKMSEKGKINASGGTQKEWSKTHADFIKALFDEGYRLRYSGAMVSDVHQILCKGGGLFSYPATKSSPNGKLRAFFEVFPLAFVIEKAGGFSTNGFNDSLLELEFSEIHATTPCFFGSKYEIEKLKQAYKALNG